MSNDYYDADAVARGEAPQSAVEPAFDAQVVFEPEAIPAEEVEIETVAVQEPEVVYVPAEPAVEEPVVKAKSKKSEPVPASEPVVYEEGQVVHLSALKYNAIARNSMSVTLVQERLMELGYTDAGIDEPGWLSEYTKTSLAEFCGCDEETCKVDCEDTITRLFAGTPVQVVS